MKLTKLLLLTTLSPFIVIFFLAFSFFTRITALVFASLKIGYILSGCNTLKSPVYYLEHPLTKRKVVLVGTVHVGEPSYYEELQRVISACTEHVVLYEQINPPSADEKVRLTSLERDMLKRFKKEFKQSNQPPTSEEMEPQFKFLNYQPEWINTDANELMLARLFLKHGILPDKICSKSKSGCKKSPELSKESSALLFNWAIFRAPIILFIKNLVPKTKQLNKVMIEERDIVASDAILSHSKNSNVVSIWGPAHFPGITKNLKAAGFKITHKEWYSALKKEKWVFLRVVKNEFFDPLISPLVEQVYIKP